MISLEKRLSLMNVTVLRLMRIDEVSPVSHPGFVKDIHLMSSVASVYNSQHNFQEQRHALSIVISEVML